MRDARRAWIGWLALAATWLAASAWWSYQAPVGYWVNEISGGGAWNENDPGSFYVASAHELAWGEPPLFVGHPGTPLVLLLRGLQETLHLVLGKSGSDFTRFTAQHLAAVHLASKLLMTVLQLASFAAIHRLAAGILRDRRAATLATLGYATSLPVLYYLSRISVEPLMVLFFALSFVATWRAQELALERRVAPALGLAALAGAASVSGAVTKLGFLGPLPFVLGLYLAVGRGPRGASQPIEGSLRRLAVASFAGAGLVSLALYSGLVDWPAFFAEWRIYASMPAAGELTLADFLPGTGPDRILLLAELVYGVFALASFALFLHRGEARERTLWLAAYALYATGLFGYRVALEGSFLPFHYFFVPQAALSVFFGYGSVQAARRLGVALSGPRAVAAALAWIALVHGVGAFAVAGSRRHDAASYEARRPALEMLAALGPRERIGVLARSPDALRRDLLALHGIELPTPWGVRRSILRQEFERLFVAVPQRLVAAGTPRIFVPALDAAIVVLRPEPREG